MVTRTKTTPARRRVPGVEQLEERRLLSVTVTPPVVNLKTTEHGHGVFTVRIVSDTQAAKALLQSPSTLTLMVTEGGGSGGTTISLGTSVGSSNGPVKVLARDFNGDGVTDLMLKFPRSVLTGLTAGAATLTLSSTGGSGGTTAPSEQATITAIGSPQQNNGQQGHHGHEGNGHGTDANGSDDQGNHGHDGNHGGGHGHGGNEGDTGHGHGNSGGGD